MNTNTVENLSYSNSKKDHFSKITLLTDRSQIRRYQSMSKEMIKNELDIQKQKFKLLQLKNEKLKMEKKNLKEREIEVLVIKDNNLKPKVTEMLKK